MSLFKNRLRSRGPASRRAEFLPASRSGPVRDGARTGFVQRLPFWLAVVVFPGDYTAAQALPSVPAVRAMGARSEHPTALLARLGMDERLLATIQNRQPLLASERECFYAMLAAAGRAKPYELEAQAVARLKKIVEAHSQREDGDAHYDQEREVARARQDRFDVAPFFNDPGSQTGRLLMIEGDARRATEIRVENPDIIQRFKIRRYYEITIFTDDSQGNPLIGCVLNVPRGMPLGEDIFARVRLAGFFMKSWAYPRGGGDLAEAEKQLAPLILGREARWLLPARPAADTVTCAVAIGSVLLVIVGMLWAAWRSGRPSGLARANSRDVAPPDFSGLD